MDALVVKPRARGDTALVLVFSSLTFNTAAIFPHAAKKISQRHRGLKVGEQESFFAMQNPSTMLLWLHTEGIDAHGSYRTPALGV